MGIVIVTTLLGDRVSYEGLDSQVTKEYVFIKNQLSVLLSPSVHRKGRSVPLRRNPRSPSVYPTASATASASTGPTTAACARMAAAAPRAARAPWP